MRKTRSRLNASWFAERSATTYFASPKDETCAPGFSHQQGWDGAPAWATITDGLPTCRFQIREIAPAVGQAWQNFYLDRDGIQTELVNTWAHLARAFAIRGIPTTFVADARGRLRYEIQGPVRPFLLDRLVRRVLRR